MRFRKSENKWLISLIKLFKLLKEKKGLILRKSSAMKCKEVRYYLNDYHEGKLIDEMRKEISLHLNKCHSCRKRSDELKRKLKSSGTLRTKIHQGREFWEGISETNESDPDFNLPSVLYSQLSRRDDPIYTLRSRRKFLHSRWIAIGAPAGAILLAIIISVLYFLKTNTAFWEVESLKGTPKAGNVEFNDSGILTVGEWLITDSHSAARLKAGRLGEVDVDPNSAVQLLETKDMDYKIYLLHGKISAKIWAPVKMFSVLTPSATASDIGSEYTIEVDDKGSSYFEVKAGKLIIESGDDKEIVPEGAVCETMKNQKPGTPYFPDASIEFRAALSRFDFGSHSSDDLRTIVENSRKKDALSLWYLLRNAEPANIQTVYARLAELGPPPGGITLEGIEMGNDNMLYLWWETLGYGSKSLWESIKG